MKLAVFFLLLIALAGAVLGFFIPATAWWLFAFLCGFAAIFISLIQLYLEISTERVNR